LACWFFLWMFLFMGYEFLCTILGELGVFGDRFFVPAIQNQPK
jgi:hypothetical protein